MSTTRQKRFWRHADVVQVSDQFAIELDGRRVKTPAKAELLLPTRAMAESAAEEWNAQSETVDPLSMPVTRSANSAIDKVDVQHAEVADMLAAYGDADLLCYRAEAPAELVARQAEAWDPALGWAEQALGVQLQTTSGIVHVPQSSANLAKLSQRVHAMTAFQLAAFHDLVSLSGSLVLGFATAMNWRDPDKIWLLSRLDEIWQQEQWGIDDTAQAEAELKRQMFGHAKRFFDLS